MDEIYSVVHSVNISEGNKILLNFRLPGESAKTNVHATMKCRNYLKRGPSLIILRLEVANHI